MILEDIEWYDPAQEYMGGEFDELDGIILKWEEAVNGK